MQAISMFTSEVRAKDHERNRIAEAINESNIEIHQIPFGMGAEQYSKIKRSKKKNKVSLHSNICKSKGSKRYV